MTIRGRCKATVYKRDTYRLKRGHGFKMHYHREQCSRPAQELPGGDDLCWQHAKVYEQAGRREMLRSAL